MNISCFTGEWIKLKFSLKEKIILPKESGVYALTNFRGDVLYVGVSVNLRRRFLEHFDSNKSSLVTPFGRSYWFYYSLCPNRKHRYFERGLLHQAQLLDGCLPWFNRVGAPC